MGKRSTMPRIPRDLYRTFDPRAVPPLLPHLGPGPLRYVEPCAGHGDLIDQLAAAGLDCAGAYDIVPMRQDIAEADATDLVPDVDFDLFITNWPWSRKIMHKLIVHLSNQKPTWALFDANWANTKQAAPFMARCRKIVAVGRLLWIPGTKMQGKEDAAWFCFDKPIPGSAPVFYGRGLVPPTLEGRQRRVCADCHMAMGRGHKWSLQPRAGLLTPVHFSCIAPTTRGPRPAPEPAPLLDWIGQRP
jgi:hypothetical protein